jgi:serine/threonine-protein kinase
MQTVGKYVLGELLGQGGMGAVYHSRHPQLDRAVAIKMIVGGGDQQAQQRFLREAQLVANLAHPNIVRIFDVDTHNGQPYIVMDFVEGGSLASRVAGGPLPLAQALPILIPLAEALAYAHSQGIIHRDLKPANVLLRSDGRPVLADFGIARLAEAEGAAQLTATGAVLGTVAYMAPEQLRGQADARSDIYALGVLVFEALSGRRPFEGDTGQILLGHLQQQPAPLRSLAPQLPGSVELLVARMLAKDPAQRPQSAAEVAEALRAIQRSTSAVGDTVAARLAEPTLRATPAAPTPPPAMAPPQRAPGRGGLLLAAGGAAAALLACVLVAGALLVPRLGLGAIAPTPRPTDGSAGFLVPTIGASGTRVPTFPVPTFAAESDDTPEPQQIAAPTAELPFAQPPAELPPLPAGPFQRIDEPILRGEFAAGPAQASVGSLSYGAVGDGIWFMGLVRNDGDDPHERVEVRVSLLDAQGNELASESGFSKRAYLNPNEVSPFFVIFSSKAELLPKIARLSVETTSDEADFQLGYSYRGLAVPEEPAQEQQFGSLSLKGRVRNTGDAPAAFPQITAVFYDAEGRVVAIVDGIADGNGEKRVLEPGKEARFELQGVIFTGTPQRYWLFVEGSKP